MNGRSTDTPTKARAAAAIAAGLGLASAAVSAYWAAGGTVLLDTIGGELERWGRERSPRSSPGCGR